MNTYLGAPNAWDALPDYLKRQAEESGEGLVKRVSDVAQVARTPLTEWDNWLLRHSPLDVSALATRMAAEGRAENEEEAFAELQVSTVTTMNKCVLIVRNAIIVEKRMGVPTIKVRRGLRLPTWWEECYQIVYRTELPWMVSSVLQLAFLGNPSMGERKPWRSP